MKRGTFRRIIASVLSAAVLLGAPGTGAYQAAAQTMGRGAAVEVAPRLIAPVSGFAAQGIAPLTTPSLNASPSAAAAASVAAPSLAALPALLAPASAAAAPLRAAAVPVEMHAAVAVAAAKAAVAAPMALGSIRGQTSERETAPAESVQAAARLFDGAVRRAALDDASTPVSAPAVGPRRGFLRRVFAAAAVATLSLTLTLPSFAQTAAPAAAPQSVTQAAAPAPADAQEVALPRPVVASITADRSDATVGERIHLTITLRNPTDKPITITSLRAGL
ncbi:MAG: hypothetical protein KGJ84_15130, partial [Elusimicrobia bacterium]|nr:hypothetical protein [Elusimicrobiota bacterium]